MSNQVDTLLVGSAAATPLALVVSYVASRSESTGISYLFGTLALAAAVYVVWRLFALFGAGKGNSKDGNGEDLKKQLDEANEEKKRLVDQVADLRRRLEDAEKRLAENATGEKDCGTPAAAPAPAAAAPADGQDDMVQAPAPTKGSIHDLIRANGPTDAIVAAVRALADVDERERGTEQTPLHVVAQTGNVAVCAALLDRGADVRARDAKRNLPVHVAAFYGNAEVVELLAARDAATVNEKNVNGNTPLHCFMNGKCAAADARAGVFRALVSHGADVGVANNSEDTVLQLAIVNDMLDGMSELGRSLVDTFVGPEESAPAALAHVNKRGETLLYTAAFYGRTALVRAMCEQHACVSVADQNGWQPLHAAASRGFADCCEELLRHGADVDAGTSDGATPALVASRNGCVDVLRTLVAHGARLDLANRDGWRPLHAACVRGQTAAVRYLLAQRVSVNCQCERSHCHTPMMMCILSREFRPDILRALLAAGADWTVPSTTRYTCLHACTVRDNSVAAQILTEWPGLRPPIDFTLRENGGKTPLELCISNNAPNTAKVIARKSGKRVPLSFSQRHNVSSLAVPEAAPAPAEALSPSEATA